MIAYVNIFFRLINSCYHAFRQQTSQYRTVGRFFKIIDIQSSKIKKKYYDLLIFVNFDSFFTTILKSQCSSINVVLQFQLWRLFLGVHNDVPFIFRNVKKKKITQRKTIIYGIFLFTCFFFKNCQLICCQQFLCSLKLQ